MFEILFKRFVTQITTMRFSVGKLNKLSCTIHLKCYAKIIIFCKTSAFSKPEHLSTGKNKTFIVQKCQ